MADKGEKVKHLVITVIMINAILSRGYWDLPGELSLNHNSSMTKEVFESCRHHF
jgi:hypothetical protein